MLSKNEQPITQPDSYTSGLLLYRQGLYAQAIDQLEQLDSHDSPIGRIAKFYSAMSHRAIGIEALCEGRFAQAEEHLRAASGAVGRCGDLGTYLASLYASIGRYRQCAETMEKSVESEIDGANERRKLALARWRAGRRPEAYMSLHEGLRELGDHSQLHLQLGLFYAAEGQYRQARSAMTRAVEADCSDPDAHYYLGLTSAAENDVRAALKSFQRAFELRPKDLMLGYQLALAGKAAQDSGYNVILQLPDTVPQSAGSEIRQLAQYLCHENDFVDTFLALPQSAIDDELFGLLAGILQMAIDEHPTYADLHYYCSSVFHRLGRTETAIDYALRALHINPRYVKALVHAGRLYAETDHLSEAISHLQQAVACGADWADVHCLTGELLARANRPDKARSHFQRALELNKSYKRASDSLRSLAA